MASIVELPLWVWILGGVLYLFVGCWGAEKFIRAQFGYVTTETPEMILRGILVLAAAPLCIPFALLWGLGWVCYKLHERGGS